jgi:hypothetical protein
MCIALAIVALVASGCSASKSTKGSGPAAPGAASTCSGIGDPPSAGQVSFVQDGRLLAVGPTGGSPKCLINDVPPAGTTPISWSGAADRVLLSSTSAVLGSGTVKTGFDPAAVASWSRPKGTAFLSVAPDGHLRRHDIAGPSLDISFLDRHESAMYHPAGRDVASVGVDHNGVYGIFLGSNRGGNVRPLARSETAKHLTLWGWTVTGNLLFTADHGDHADLHQLDLGTGNLVTLDSAPSIDQLGPVSASTLSGGGVAWVKGSCAAGTRQLNVVRGGKQVTVAPGPAQHGDPVGWLPGGVLIVFVADQCGGSTGQLFAAHDGATTRLATGVSRPETRAVLPPGPELPPQLFDDAPT